MSGIRSFLSRRAGSVGAVAAVVLYVATAQAQSVDSKSESPRGAVTGRIDFDDADLPAATVEVDLSQEMFGDLFGLGDAAVAGVAETLLESAGAENKGTKLAAEQLEAARQILQLARSVVREVRIRVYEDLPEESGQAASIIGRFDGQLSAANWESLVRVRKDDESARISLIRSDGAVRGVFIVAANGDQLVLANAVCDISPENVKKLTSAATKIGLENGLQQAIESKMQHMKHRLPPQTPVPPVPAAPPASEQ